MTITIHGQPAVLARAGEPPVYLCGDKFAVQIGQEWFLRTTMKAIEKVIAATKKGIAVAMLGDTKPIEIVDITPAGVFLTASGGKLGRSTYATYYFWDEPAWKDYAKLRDKHEQIRLKLDEEMDSFIDRRFKRVTRDSFKKLVDGQEKP